MNIEELFNKKINHALKQWQFDDACHYHNELLQYSINHLSDYVKLLADFGKLDKIFYLFDKHGFDFIEEQVHNPQQKHPNVIKHILNFIRDEYIPSLYNTVRANHNHTLLSLSSRQELCELLKYVETHADEIINTGTSPGDNMILNFAINQLISANLISSELGIKIVTAFANNKNINGFRKRFVLSSVLNYFFTKGDRQFFKLSDQWYNHIQRIATQLNSFFIDEGAKKTYSQFNNAIANANNIRMKCEPRVAICISGMFRGNETAIASAMKNLHENIISPLNADVFIHTWDNYQIWPGIGGAGPQNWVVRLFGDNAVKLCPQELTSFVEFKKYFQKSADIIEPLVSEPFTREFMESFIQPTSFSVDNEANFISSLGKYADKFLSRGKHNQAKMFYGIYEATQLMIAHEDENNFKYDYVIRTRPDVTLNGEVSKDFLKQLQSNELGTEMHWVVGPGDTFNIACRNVHIKMANLWEASLAANQLSPFECFHKYDAHSLLFLWMMKNHITPVTQPVKAYLSSVTSSSIPTEVLNNAFSYDLKNAAKKFEHDENAKKFLDYISGVNK